MTSPTAPAPAPSATAEPWPGLWALVIGFFMILVDATIVNVANPAIMKGLNLGSDYNAVIWVTSAYLLCYAVPMLVTGRLGDRFGPRRIYLIGLTLFTVASLWCGFSGWLPGGGIGMLIAARAFQGVGASMMSPQTMALITRMFPPDRRGAAMGVWGSVAGIATLIGPLLGGVLVDALGWEWIFFVNVPIGLAAFAAAWKYVPKFPTHPHRFDLLGVALSTFGLFFLVFGIQEGETYHWGSIWGAVSVPLLIISGIVLLTAFVGWQARTKGEPLVPLSLFNDRNFALSNAAIASVGLAIASFSLPLVFFFQTVRGLTPTQSALMLAPSAILSMILAPLIGRLIDRVNPRDVAIFGLVAWIAGMLWYVQVINTTTPILWLLGPSFVMGFGSACVWGPLSTTATRNLPPHYAGAGAGVYNTTRQVGSVLGSAGMSALLQLRLAADLPAGVAVPAQAGGMVPAALRDGFSRAMAESILLPVAALACALLAVSYFQKPVRRKAAHKVNS